MTTQESERRVSGNFLGKKKTKFDLEPGRVGKREREGVRIEASTEGNLKSRQSRREGGGTNNQGTSSVKAVPGMGGKGPPREVLPTLGGGGVNSRT